MAFDTAQQSYVRFRQILKERTTPVVVWAGAGLSAPAGLPTWLSLRDTLIEAANQKIQTQDSDGKKHTKALVDLAEIEPSLWISFDHLRRALGEATWITTIRNSFESAHLDVVPDAYLSFWELGINGFLTLNIDKLATRSFSQFFAGKKALRDFSGLESHRHADVLQSGQPFVVNLHGTIESDQTWIFTQSDFEKLYKIPAYRSILHACFASRVVLFAGISAEDQAAGGHLASLKQEGINLGGHYWLTNRNEHSVDRWAEEIGINRIYYSSPDNKHSEIKQFFHDLKVFLPKDEAAPPVVPKTNVIKSTVLPDAEELEKLSANEIRIQLNKRANQILSASSYTKSDEYEAFWSTYSEPIYRAWSISTTHGKNFLFDFQMQAALAKGAFGQVYKALGADGKTVAIKVLHGNIREHKEMLQSFRRGVASMRILSERNVKGIVPYVDAWEIPASAVMEFIDGPNLEDAVDGRMIDDWEGRLRIASDLVMIIQAAHSVPERVLHRDIRPANIMLKNFYNSPESWELVVLDFDLSWHRDATESSLDLSKSMNSYLAPEQLNLTRKKHTRNALVDSYGFGMTMYFLASGEHPSLGQHQYKNWSELLEAKIARKQCVQWKSLPKRFARLIDNSTKDTQVERWDLTRIAGELRRLQQCLGDSQRITSAEIFAEEIVSRCPTASTNYIWNTDLLAAVIELRSGYTLKIVGDETDRLVKVYVDWIQTGDRQFENVRKWIGAASDKCVSEMKKGLWRIHEKQITASSCRIEATCNISDLQKKGNLDAASTGLANALESLRLV